MKTYLDCYPCFLRQALDAARLAGADEAQQAHVMQQTLALLQDVSPGATPPETGDRIHRLVRTMIAHSDPYKEAKIKSTEQALAHYPRLKAMVAESDNPLDCAVRIAIAGNSIDFGPRRTYDLDGDLRRVLEQPFAIYDVEEFRGAIAEAACILYLGDNAGETVFDRVLIETLEPPVKYAVKGGPTLNDATWEDAEAAGLSVSATLISTGVDAPGTILDRSAEDFRRVYDTADVIIAKGQANYETLSPGDSRLFFMLQVKCPVIARDIGVSVNSIVLKQGLCA
jgi:hypothetical protein